MLGETMRDRNYYLLYNRSKWTPNRIPGLQLWLRGDGGISLGSMGAVTETGTSPAVTLSGTPALTVISILIIITLGGIRGTATFQWSSDGGVSFTTGVPTAASVVLGSTGVTATFATGTYVLNDSYSAPVDASSWLDQSGVGSNFAQATTTKQPAYLSPSVITSTGRAISGVTQICPTTITVGLRFRIATLPGAANYGVMTQLWQVANANTFMLIASNLGGAYKPYSFTGLNSSAGTAGVGIADALDTSFHSIIITYNGGTNTTTGNYTATLDGVTKTVVSSGTLGPANTNLRSLGALIAAGNTISQPLNCEFSKVVVTNTVISAANKARLVTYLSS